MKKSHFFAVLLLFVFPVLQSQDRSSWFEFYLPWDDSSRTVTDMSDFLDPPAGKYGFTRVTPDGHFQFENSPRPVRFVGVVNVAIANFPSREQAKILAARMAKFGINLVRIHLVDVDGQYGLFENSSASTMTLSADRLDRMDYFIKCLEDKGIYFNFCLQCGRVFKEGDSTNAPVVNEQSKYVTLFNERLINLQKQYAMQTVGHLNPYTGKTYAGDPAMATVELTNENSLFNGWFGWNRDYLFADNPVGIGPYYASELDTLFLSWLRTKYGDDTNLRAAWTAGQSTGAELVLNPSFEEGTANWSTWIQTSSGAFGEIVTDGADAKDGSTSLKVTVNSPGTEGWHVQVKTHNFSVEKNNAYKLSFFARADAARDLSLDIMENQTWDWIMGPSWTTSPEWKKYEFYFTANKTTNNLIVQFNFGLQTGTCRLDSVSVKRFGGEGLRPDESLAAGKVDRVRFTEIGKYSSRRIGDNAEFYVSLERKYADTLTSWLRNVAEVRCPVTFTNNYYGLASIYSQSGSDYIDTHHYWSHPGFPHGWSETDFTMDNTSMLLDPPASTVNRMPLCRVKDMPLMVSEYNHPYPYVFQAEAPSILYAYGSYLDLDGILWHAYYDYMNHYDERQQDMFFDVAMNPVIMTQFLLSVPYRMGYIHPPVKKVYAHYRRQDVFDGTKAWLDRPAVNIPGGSYGASFLTDGFANASFDDDSTWIEGNLSMPDDPVVSESGELSWDGTQGIFTVNNPYWQGATGFLKGKTIRLADVTFSGISTTDDLDFAAVHLIALDSLPIRESKKLILLTSARLENEGFLWNESKTSPVSIGGTKALCEPVKGTIEFHFPVRDSFFIYRLNETGERSQELPYDLNNGNIRLNFGQKTLWYEILNDSAVNVPVTPSAAKAVILSGIKNYPDPCDEFTILEFPQPSRGKAIVQVWDALGRLVRSEVIPLLEGGTARIKIDLAGQSEGLYFYGLKTSDGRSAFGKFMVMR